MYVMYVMYFLIFQYKDNTVWSHHINSIYKNEEHGMILFRLLIEQLISPYITRCNDMSETDLV